MPIVKPNVTRIWANAGAIIAPSNAKQDLGWIAEIPTFQNTNWLENKQDTFQAHVNEWGIAEWDNVTDYPIGAWARSTVDQEIYVSQTTPNINNEPSATTPASWQLLSVVLPGGLGTAAVEDVGVAAGNVLQYAINGTGTFGLGATVPVPFVGDCDTLLTTAFTAIGAGASNRPPAATSSGTIVTTILDATNSTQMFLGVGADEAFYRRRAASVYQSWIAFPLGQAFGTAAFVNTGATGPDVPTVADLPGVAVTSFTAGQGLVTSGAVGSITVDMDVNSLSTAAPVLTDPMPYFDASLNGHRKANVSAYLGLSQPGKTFTSLLTVSAGGADITGTLAVDGDITATGNITAAFVSDESMKDIVEHIDPEAALAFVLESRTVRFNWNDRAVKLLSTLDKEKTEIGFIAQDFERGFPEIVKKGDKYMSLTYDKSPVILAAAMKGMHEEVNQLRDELNVLRAEMGAI